MIDIDYINHTETEISDTLKERLERALEAGLEQEQVHSPVEVTVSFVTPEEIRKLNADFRDTDRATDVLSFPVFGSLEEIWEYPENLPALIGDIIISPDQARIQAEEYGQSFEDEVEYLAIHSLMHLLGYDHMIEEEKTIMREHEKQVLRAIGAPEYRI